MNKFLCRGLCCVLSLVMLLGLCACGEDEEGATVTNPTINMEDYTAEQSYHLTKNADNTFAFDLADHAGQILYHRDGLKNEPTFTALDKDNLQVVVKTGNGASNQWAVFFNVKSSAVSRVFTNFLHATTTHVAYVDYLTDQYHVFVAEIKNPDTGLTAVTLKGLVKDEGQDPIHGLEVNDQGDLVVTYPVEKGEKTVTVDIP